METLKSAILLFNSSSSLSYLWGMETSYPSPYLHYMFWFLSYLWGMETWFCTIRIYFCILTSSYPTYEEWKHLHVVTLKEGLYLFLSYLWGMETCKSDNYRFVWNIVLILPMRNGNHSKKILSLAFSSFLSYLWGMETQIYTLGEYAILKFLSYLWGMETRN